MDGQGAIAQHREFKRITRAAYNSCADTYVAKFQAMFEVHRREEFGKFINLLPDGRVLDLGAGGGDHAHYFEQQGLDVTCIDLSERMVDICRARGFRAEVMDLEDLTFPPAAFNGIWAVCSLLHVPKTDLPAVVMGLHRVLTPEGVLYACVKEQRGNESDGLILDQEGNHRFFAFWKQEEFIHQFVPHFSVIESRKNSLGDRSFIEFFFRKRHEQSD